MREAGWAAGFEERLSRMRARRRTGSAPAPEPRLRPGQHTAELVREWESMRMPTTDSITPSWPSVWRPDALITMRAPWKP